MKNSAVKRMIAVLLCLVVFAGSELTGLTNIVGDLFATDAVEISEPEYDEPTETLDLQAEEDVEEAEETPADDGLPEEETVPSESEEAVSGLPEEETKSEDLTGEEISTENTEDPSEEMEAGADTPLDEQSGTEDTAKTEEQTQAEMETKETEELHPEISEEPEEKEKSYPEFEDQYSDDKVEIHVSAKEGILPEGVTLSVTPIVKQDMEELEAQDTITQEELELAKEVNEKYDATAEKLEETVAEDESKNIAGFLAYDISFLMTETDEETGEEVQTEIEPDGNVSVTMDFAEGYLPEELVDNEYVSVDSVDIVHMKETDGELQPEVLADAAIDITENVEVKTAEFTVDSFSIFMISWTGSGLPMVTIEFTDESGGSLNNVEPVALTISEEFTFDTKEISPTGQWSQYYQIRESMSDGTGGLKDVDYVFSKAIYLPDNGYGTETGEKIPISKIDRKSVV